MNTRRRHSESMAIKVGIVEDNRGIRNTLSEIICDAPEFECVCTCENAEEALRLLPKHAPDVVVMDIELPGMSGIDCTAELKRILPRTQVMIFTVYEDNDQIFKALEAGASGYLLKRSTPDEIVEAICDIHKGGAPMSSEIARKVVQSFRKTPSLKPEHTEQLTPREEEILGLLAQGYVTKEIADKLSINYDTVRTHLKHIYEKLHVRSRTEAVIKYLH
jgi:DNA-binding NarL/FixJ family response regulator